MQIKSLEEVINRLQYKADNIKAKLEPSYFTECVEYLKSNVSEKLTSSTDLEIVASLPSLYPMMQDFEEEAILNVVASVNNAGWIPVEEKYPDTDEYILLSLSNFSINIIGRYEEDENGGAFYCGDEDITLVSQDLFVNAWMPLVKPYRPEGE